MNKRRDLGVEEKLDVLKKYDELPKMSQRQAAYKLNVSQSLLGPLLRQNAEDLAKKMGKDDFVAAEDWFYRWKKRENISFIKPHEEQGEADQVAARSWNNSKWLSLIAKYPPSFVFNADETGLYFRALLEHTYAFKNEKTRGTKTSKERLTILCCASIDGEKRKLLAIGKSKNLQCFKGVKNLPVDYTANSNAWMTKEIFIEWLTKWDNELRHDVLLLVGNCTAHMVTVKFKHINLVLLPSNTTSIIQPCDQKIIRTFKAYYRTGMRKNVISVIDVNLEQELCTLRAHEIAKKMTVFEGLHLAYEAWNIVSKITIRNCFRHDGFILCPKEVEIAVERPTDLSTELYNEWINIDEEVQTTELVTEEDICGEIQSKRFKKNVVGDIDEEVPDEKPPSTKEMLEALQILRRGIQQRGDFDVFEKYKSYEDMIMKLAEETKIQ
ncbi:hypothetical protein QTP88_018247 [Uroleucon formosanum]